MVTDNEYLQEKYRLRKQQEETMVLWGKRGLFAFLWHTLIGIKAHYDYWREARRYFGPSRHRWFELSKKWRGFRLILSHSYEDEFVQLGISPGLGIVFITLPFRLKWLRHERQYGVYYHEATIWFWWGKRKLTIDMPWQRTWVRGSYLLADGVSWDHNRKGDPYVDRYTDEYKAKRWASVFDYTYVKRNSQKQEVLATVMIHEVEWRPLWFQWLPLFKTILRSIDISFDQEVGEGKNSWKGGTLGCSYKMLPDETPEQCLRRMEKDRRFER